MALPKLNVPVYETILPSTEKVIKYRPFLVKEEKILDRWQDKIVKTNGANGSFDIGYYDDYAKYSKIIVTKFSVSGKKTFSYEYREVFPKIVTSIDLSHGISSGPVKISATFAYTNWKDITSP